MANKPVKQNKTLTILGANVLAAILLFVVCAALPPTHAFGASSSKNVSGIAGPAKYVGERLVYKLSFLLFDEAATCSTSLAQSKTPGLFIGTFIGETKGFVGWVTSYRKYTYTSKMRLINNGREFRTVSFKTEKRIGDRLVVIETKFDYKENMINTLITENGNRQIYRFPIKGGIKFDDIISGFYNTRSKNSDEIKEGAYFDLKSFTNNKTSVFNIHIQSVKEKRRNTLFSDRYKRDNFIFKIKIAKEIFGSKEGLLCIAINREHLPVKLIIEDVLLFGDVEGEFLPPKRSRQ